MSKCEDFLATVDRFFCDFALYSQNLHMAGILMATLVDIIYLK